MLQEIHHGRFSRRLLRLSRIVQELLILARADLGNLQMRTETFFLEDLVEDALSSARVLAHRKGVIVDAPPAPEVQLSGDAQLLGMLLVNLFDNAVRHSSPGQTVRLAMEHSGAAITLRVADEGPGIAAEHQPHIFERFYSGNRGEGTGLGLAIARWVAEIHQGALHLERSQPGETVFRLQLPAAV